MPIRLPRSEAPRARCRLAHVIGRPHAQDHHHPRHLRVPLARLHAAAGSGSAAACERARRRQRRRRGRRRQEARQPPRRPRQQPLCDVARQEARRARPLRSTQAIRGLGRQQAARARAEAVRRRRRGRRLRSLLVRRGAGKPIRKLDDQLEELAKEAQLEALVVRLGDLGIDLARATELRAAMQEFKGEGKRKLHCHAENLDNASYYLLSVCDELSMAPVGMVMIPGPAATPIHLKGMLDKLGVQADFVHVGAFKGAAEPLTRDAPSPEMIETLEAVIGRAHATMVEGIAASRGKTPEQVTAWIDQGLYTNEQAKAAGLIDAVEPWEPYLERARADRPWKQVENKESPLADPTALQRFLGLMPPKRPDKPHVALVYAVGNIIDGKGQGPLGATSEIASGQLVPVLDRLAEDDKVAAVVLRVDSGGGSALASEQIWHAVERVKTRKPVIVSMAGVAASGGYYISAGANEIFADADTLTGSIGVVGGKIVFGPALEDVGVKTYAIQKGKRAMMWSPMQPWTEDERALVTSMMEETYEVFLSRVAAGRKLERDAVHAIAQGRVWTGADAKERGLVDTIGGLDQALARAQELGKVEDEVGLEVYPADPTLKDILGSFGQIAGVQADPAARLLALIEPFVQAAGPEQGMYLVAIQRALQTMLALQGTKVWAVEWTPAIR
ncbi:MAG: signal peptide peptidase SppA [Deltaproteobacteria bacterium]|nr:signal peptide peptidase SppA [Deltaproteobacteria bacterium]